MGNTVLQHIYGLLLTVDDKALLNKVLTEKERINERIKGLGKTKKYSVMVNHPLSPS